MKNLFLSVFLFLSVSISAPVQLGNLLVENRNLNNVVDELSLITDTERIILIQKILYLLSPSKLSPEWNQYIKEVFNVSSNSELFIQKFRTLTQSSSALFDNRDPLTGLLISDLDACYGIADFSGDIDYLIKTIRETDLNTLYQNFYQEGVISLMREFRQKDMEKDIENLKKIINGTEINDQIGGIHNKLSLLLWEIIPYLEDFKANVDNKSNQCLILPTICDIKIKFRNPKAFYLPL